MVKRLVIIPTYNERENLPLVVERILELKKDLQILIIDDNSPDGTGQIADELVKKYPEVSVLHREQKQGLGVAYMEGFKWALQRNYDCVLTMDADLSHNPKDIPRFLEKAKNFDVVVGSRYIQGGGMPEFNFFRRLLSKGAITRSFIEFLNPDEIAAPGYAFHVEMIKKAENNGFKVTEIPIIFSPRKFGQSKLSLKEAINSARALFILKWNKK